MRNLSGCAIKEAGERAIAWMSEQVMNRERRYLGQRAIGDGAKILLCSSVARISIEAR